MEYAVDMQGFKQPVDDFILKELAIVPLQDTTDPVVLLFKEPYPWRRLSDKYRKENLWLEHNHHGISWTSGNLPYTEIGKILRTALSDASTLYVCGSIRKEWLERFKFKVLDITKCGFPSECQSKKRTL